MLPTGIPNLDLILGGGIRDRDVLLVAGPPGACKTTLCLQAAFHAAASGESVLYASTPSEPPSRLIDHARSFSFFDEGLVGTRLFLANIYPLVKQGLDKIAAGLATAVAEHDAKLVILDGLMTIRDLHPRAHELRAFIYELGATLSAQQRTTIITSSREEGRPAVSDPEGTMVDAILNLGMEDVGTQTVRTIRVRKARGLAPLLGRHSLRVDLHGITVFPRLESMAMPPMAGWSGERMPMGPPQLDAMMSGGLPAGSVTLLAGAMGTGKTVCSIQYLVEGARRGERGLYVGFRENPELLIEKAQAFGLDLRAAVSGGLVRLSYRLPVDLVFDDVIGDVWREVDQHGPRRLVIDSITDLQEGIFEPRRHRGLMSALAALLRGKGVTSLITKEITQLVGPELDFSDSPLAILAENLILTRWVELRGELHRIISVIKMRDTRHDHSIREYVIGEKGLQVLTKLDSAAGLLTGSARPTGVASSRRRAHGSQGRQQQA